MEHLFRLQMLLKNFKGYAGGLTERVRAGAMAFADAAGRLTYLPSAQVSKEELVRGIATRDRVAALELRLEPSRNLCHQRARVAGPTDGHGRHRLYAARKYFYLD